jgi:hypothetical protein
VVEEERGVELESYQLLAVTHQKWHRLGTNSCHVPPNSDIEKNITSVIVQQKIHYLGAIMKNTKQIHCVDKSQPSRPEAAVFRKAHLQEGPLVSNWELGLLECSHYID